MKLKSFLEHDGKEVEIQFRTDYQSIKELIKQYGNSTDYFYGVGEDGNKYTVSITDDKVDVIVIKDNKVIQDVTYYVDGFVEDNIHLNDMVEYDKMRLKYC